ncbi:cytochrome oxidase putative small subunit CydP [Psychromonas aquimarina]|uniref:cytochrome oxidase putative small subunit CydP n=1 Tax=Psychromonas aquimarina TaxID=444919 RepID=UPI0003FECFB0|nr:cytochrome oxidase putative small subunit CydP [Psychromonas aquimarina]
MFKKLSAQQGIFSIPLIREIAVILIIKVIVIFTIKHFYFSNPVPFDEDHLSVELSRTENTQQTE